MQVKFELVKRAIRKAMHVEFAQISGDKVVYRDSILADSLEEAIANRFRHCGGKLPDGFIVEKVTDCR